MKKTWFIVSCLFVLLLISSCTTGFILSEDEESNVIPFEGRVETEDYTVIVTADYANGVLAPYITLSILNQGNVPIVLDLNKSAYVGYMSSQRMIDGETRVINANLSQPLFTVAPKSILVRNLYDPQQLGFSGNTGDIKELNPRVSVCLTIDGKDQYCDIELQKPTTGETKELLGTVEFSAFRIFPLFIGSNSRIAINAAKKEAVKQFGEGVKVENIHYEAQWNPLSLLLYCDLLGQFRNISGTADVVRIIK